jgi:SAM-dependent methyltransferase
MISIPQKIIYDVFFNIDKYEKIIRFYRLAQSAFDKNNLVLSDHYTQKALRTRDPNRKCKDIQTILENEKEIDFNRLLDFRENLFSVTHKKSKVLNFEVWKAQKNKTHLSRIAKDILLDLNYDKFSILDFGCGLGAVLKLIELDCEELEIELIGIEPDSGYCDFAKKHLLSAKIHNSDQDIFLNKNIEFPEKISILLLSNVCEILFPEEINKLLEFAKHRCEYILILGDIMNMYGDFEIMRHSYILYPYKKLLKNYNFNIETKIYADIPNMVTTGFLIAKNET